ncbi:MAG: transcription elongation factor GreA [Planctomycetota bacterium]
MIQRIPMTAEGLKKLQEKLERLTNDVRSKVETRLGEARAMGDISDNAEFSSAREELWRVDRQIAELQNQIGCADVITARKINKNEVSFGARVKVKDKNTKFEEEFIFVGEGESNLSENRIAITTPIGQGLLGHKIGDVVKINIPAGTITYEILEISYE